MRYQTERRVPVETSPFEPPRSWRLRPVPTDADYDRSARVIIGVAMRAEATDDLARVLDMLGLTERLAR